MLLECLRGPRGPFFFIRNAFNIVTCRARDEVDPVCILSPCPKISYCIYIKPKLATYLQRSRRQSMSLGRVQPGWVSFDDQRFYYQKNNGQLYNCKAGPKSHTNHLIAIVYTPLKVPPDLRRRREQEYRLGNILPISNNSGYVQNEAPFAKRSRYWVKRMNVR